MRRIVASILPLTLALLLPLGAEAKALTLGQLFDMGKWLDCVDDCPPAVPSSPYEAHAARQACLAECGVAPRQWEKTGYPPVDRADHRLAFLEYQNDPEEGGGFCSADPDGNVLIPGALCPGELCKKAEKCSQDVCDKTYAEEPAVQCTPHGSDS